MHASVAFLYCSVSLHSTERSLLSSSSLISLMLSVSSQRVVRFYYSYTLASDCSTKAIALLFKVLIVLSKVYHMYQ